ncbi:MAG: hypothetical protein JRJ41_13510 [Deltaproteobacteria bacterium]|nr:hypothetical protein [Deltaproteobacteria bacterium]
MSKKIIVGAAVIIFFLFFLTRSMALEGLEKKKVPDALNPELDHLLALVSPDSKATFDPRRIEKILDFMLTPKNDQTLYYADKKFGANSVYYEFDIWSDLNYILQYDFNSEIPSYALRPSSMRLSYRIDVNSQIHPLPKFWDFLSSPDFPITFRSIEHIEITPDLNTGAYFKYDIDEVLILCKHQGRNLFISISKMKENSDVGKKGLVLGKDEDWHYFYSGQPGISIRGLGWVKSYMYDFHNISLYYDVGGGASRVRCGTFKWLRAGWANLNMVTTKHIHRGLERFARDYKAILEYPSLPKAQELASIFSNYEKLTLDDLRKKVENHINILKSLLGDEKLDYKNFAEQIQSGRYLNQMTRQEMQAVLIKENMKSILRQ